MDNEFDHIFREAGQAYRVQPPKSVWRNIRYELEEARGYRLLQWIWPMRLAVAFLVVGASLISVIESYDSLAISKGEPIDYDQVARELGMVDEVAENQSNELNSLSDELNLSESSAEIGINDVSPRNEVPNQPTSKKSLVQDDVLTQYESGAGRVAIEGEPNMARYSSPLKMNTLYALDTPPIEHNLFRMEAWQYANSSEISSFRLDRKWYTQISYNLGSWNTTFNTESILELYQYEDPYLSYIPDADPEFIQKIDKSWTAQIEVGYRVSNHVAIESGIHLTHLEGSQRTILNVEEQNRYTLERNIAVPAGFNSQRIISFDEEVIDSKVLRDTLTSSFSYQSVSVPFNVIFSARKNKLGVYAGSSLGLQFWNRIETSSSSELYSELNQSQEVLIFQPTEMRLGAVTGIQYFVSNQFSLLLDGSLNQHLPTSSNTIILENYQSWQVGLGVRYDF